MRLGAQEKLTARACMATYAAAATAKIRRKQMKAATSRLFPVILSVEYRIVRMSRPAQISRFSSWNYGDPFNLDGPIGSKDLFRTPASLTRSRQKRLRIQNPLPILLIPLNFDLLKLVVQPQDALSTKMKTLATPALLRHPQDHYNRYLEQSQTRSEARSLGSRRQGYGYARPCQPCAAESWFPQTAHNSCPA